jgi:threonine dehydratase
MTPFPLEELDFAAGVAEASARIRPEAAWTPLEPWPSLSRRLAARVWIKADCDQPTGSFKIRGAANKLKCLAPQDKKRGIVSASTGNHGLALSRAAGLEGTPLTLFVPESLSPEKRQRLQAEPGVSLEFVPASCEQAEARARECARCTGRPFISPYNDPDIILGQGTAGLEILANCPEVEDVIVPVGGGGLIAGIAGYIKSVRTGVRVFGVEPARSAFMAASLRAGRLVNVEEKPTLADAVAGGIEPGALTFPLCRRLVDDILTVEERRIADSLALLFHERGRVVEGAGALALAGLLGKPEVFRGRAVVLVASGGNIAAGLHRRVVAEASPIRL